MDRRTVYINLDDADLACTAEGVELNTDVAVVVLSGALDSFERLGRTIVASGANITDGPVL
ncbi:hypothetical protein BRM3_09040 [Brachybacterium huguangmaarense]|uniref:Uncharacterized protein n=1 Tax=Brachybacterium huguangmaarense TaxID=1652028 RepID=A0ABY6FXZ7_9MICO|nr:hypothetical protein [Brachybacterium huguangmaarense]UYG15790.1 hypothetical protein BRM3_09040 [Brachybacterium huguangmaarense]